MMEELSVPMAFDAHAMDQMSEEEILACLVSETGPQFKVPKNRAKLRESRLQIMDDEEDPLDKYLKENRRLQQISVRLEQENDNLAHRLISSKVSLRNALDKTEDRVDELSKDLLKIKRRLDATEGEMRGKEEEAAMLKEVFRRELEKAEVEVKRSSGIIADYKQICSQLTERLERKETAHREEVDLLKKVIRLCSCCQHVLDSEKSTTAVDSSPAEVHGTTEPIQDEDCAKMVERRRADQEESQREQIRELEKKLAQTKLQMVEAKCKIQELEHQKGILANDLQEAKNSWISKAFTSLRTSGAGGLHGVNMNKEGAPTLAWKLHGGSFSGWSGKKLALGHRQNQENL